MTSHPSDQPVRALRARMIEDMTVRGFNEQTRSNYIRNVRAFAAFISRSPDTATAEDLRRFQHHQAQTGVALARQLLGMPAAPSSSESDGAEGGARRRRPALLSLLRRVYGHHRDLRTRLPAAVVAPPVNRGRQLMTNTLLSPSPITASVPCHYRGYGFDGGHGAKHVHSNQMPVRRPDLRALARLSSLPSPRGSWPTPACAITRKAPCSEIKRYGTPDSAPE